MDILNTDQTDQNQIDPNVDPLEELTGPGKKFDRSKYQSDEEMYKAIAKGKVEADNYVKHILARHDELREDYKRVTDVYNAGPKLQELLDKFATQGQQSPTAQPQAVIEDKPVVDLTQIEQLVEAKLTATKQKEQEEANARMVEGRLIEHYGPDYKSVLKQQIDQLGMSVDLFNDLAKKSPQVLIKTLGLGATRQEDLPTPPNSSTRSSAFSPTGNKRTWSYYQKMRKDNPRLYRDPKTQAQMFKDASELGAAFEDGDWHQFK